jgi:hypothetical protein
MLLSPVMCAAAKDMSQCAGQLQLDRALEATCMGKG